VFACVNVWVGGCGCVGVGVGVCMCLCVGVWVCVGVDVLLTKPVSLGVGFEAVRAGTRRWCCDVGRED
jgi:hypothetical protein